MAKRKTSPKPKHSKKKKKSNSKNNNQVILKYINRAILFLIIFIIVFFIYEVFIKDDISKISNDISKNNKTTKEIKHKKTIKELSKEFEEKTKELTIEYIPSDDEEIVITKKPKAIENDNKYTEPSVFKDYKEDTNITSIEQNEIVVSKPEVIQKKKIVSPANNKPMLAIIIDDVSNRSHVRKIQNINYPITMSFLPPTPRHKNSATIAQGIKVHMIHLPLEAGNRKYEEINTLHVGDSLAKIDARIKYLRDLYPHTLYTNNHTGSKFTADEVSMDRLTKTLKKYNFYYIDSRTTAKTVIKKYAKKYNLHYMSRNVFIDNIQDKQYIIKQLKSAIKIAKKKGFAIAIGHPHTMTLQTLKEVKYLFKDVNVVNINTLAHR